MSRIQEAQNQSVPHRLIKISYKPALELKQRNYVTEKSTQNDVLNKIKKNQFRKALPAYAKISKNIQMFSDKASLPPFNPFDKKGQAGNSYATTPNQGDTAQNSTYEDLSIIEAQPKKPELVKSQTSK